MKIYTKVVFDIETMRVESAESFEYEGPVALCKGDKTAQATEQAQANFTNTLQKTFATNNAKQQAQLDFLTKQLESGVTNPQGYSPETLAAMRTQATENAARSNTAVMQALQEKNALQSGASNTTLPNGVQAQLEAGVENASAANEANAQLGITQREGELEAENKQRAIQELEGTAQLENPEGMASGATGAASSVSNLSQAVTQANGPGIGSILGGVAGAALGGWAGGGFKIPGH